MENILVLKFEDFKQLCKDKRIYYYVGNNYYDLMFLSDGMIIKTTLLSSEIENKERFFSDKMFYGAMQIMFQITNPKSDISQMPILLPLTEPVIDIKDYQDEEVKQTDIQKEGIDTDII